MLRFRSHPRQHEEEEATNSKVFALIQSLFALLLLCDPRVRPLSVQIDADRFFHSKDESARVLHAPLYVGHHKVDRETPMVRHEFDLGWYCDLVLGPVDAEHAMNLHRRSSGRSDSSLNPVR